MDHIQSKTIVFVTGAFVTHKGWDEWKTYFESKGYTTFAPPWPNKDASAEELRARHPDKDIASLSLGQVVESYAEFVKSLPERPIIIGHSIGGLITQILVNRDLAAAGVAIHPVPPQGVFPLEFSFFKATWGPLGLFSSINKTYLMTLKDWQYAFTNGMSVEAQEESYKANVIPESKRVLRGTLTATARIDFKKPHAPLLILAGSTDNIIPASLNKRNFNRYSQTNGSVTELKVLEGRNHFVIGQPTWKETADIILEWLRSQ